MKSKKNSFKVAIDGNVETIPAKIIKTPEIPRTKSGKIVELAVKKIINGEKINNIEAIANPGSLDFFKNLSILKN